jgi:hypothetical protein
MFRETLSADAEVDMGKYGHTLAAWGLKTPYFSFLGKIMD